jgi:hypothetical protein
MTRGGAIPPGADVNDAGKLVKKYGTNLSTNGGRAQWKPLMGAVGRIRTEGTGRYRVHQFGY